MDDNKKKIDAIIGDYQYGFKTETTPFYSIPKGISEEVVRKISEYKQEPSWMTDIRV
jgi:Fe-S cluster assembly protein SufB